MTTGENHVGLQVTSGGGVAALRALEGALENEGGGRALHADLVAREARITLGQLPEDLRGTVKTIRIFGPREHAQSLADALRQRFEPAGMNVEIVSTYPPGEFGKTIPVDSPVSRAFSLAARHITGHENAFEFLPPKVSAFQQATAKYASGKWRSVGATAAAILVIVLALFGFQQWQINRYTKQWKGMETQVRELNDVLDQTARDRPWYDTTFRGLSIMKQLTLAFPQNGSLTAKTVEVRDMNTVSVGGNAQSSEAVSSTIHRLQTVMPGATNFIYTTRGTRPTLFTFDFQLPGNLPL